MVNLHESRISQLKSQAILRLRSHLAESGRPRGEWHGMSDDRNSSRMSTAPNARIFWTMGESWPRFSNR